jgi:hypothetical protein
MTSGKREKGKEKSTALANEIAGRLMCDSMDAGDVGKLRKNPIKR